MNNGRRRLLLLLWLMMLLLLLLVIDIVLLLNLLHDRTRNCDDPKITLRLTLLIQGC